MKQWYAPYVFLYSYLQVNQHHYMCFRNIMIMSYIASTLYITHQGLPFPSAWRPGASKITSQANGFGQICLLYFI